jgi:ABC-type hemin transport system substrate-binding protein
MKKSYGPLPGQLAEDLLAERRQLDQFHAEIREIASWLSQREQAASIMSLYGK